jgi:hypothetical protein
MSRVGCWIALLAGAAAPGLGAQGVARLQARADSLAAEWRRASAIADLIDSLGRARALAGRDTIRVGALTIVANPSPLPLRQAAARAWPVIDSLYGSEAQELAHRPYVIVAVDPDTTVERRFVSGGMEVTWDRDAASLAQLLLLNVPIAPRDTGLEHWLGGSVVPAIHPERQRGDVYVQLVTAPSRAARGCFLGDIARCRDGLDLFTATEPLPRWYPGADERRAIVLQSFSDYFNQRDQGTRRATLQSCAGGSDSACTALLESLPPGALPRPLAADARETLVHVALRLGGREAYHRLLERPSAPITERLAAAAGTSLDTVVTQWRSEILAARPEPVTLPPWGVWAALGWTALFAVCGLRSSRWRVN